MDEIKRQERIENQKQFTDEIFTQIALNYSVYLTTLMTINLHLNCTKWKATDTSKQD